MVSVKQDRGDWDESVGPATYYVKHGNLGSAAPKHAIGMKGVFCSGPPDSLVQPVDTRGTCANISNHIYDHGPITDSRKIEFSKFVNKIVFFIIFK